MFGDGLRRTREPQGVLPEFGEGRRGEVFDRTDTSIGFKDDQQKTVLIDILDQKAKILTLLINKVEAGFAYDSGNILGRSVRRGCQSRQGCGVEALKITPLGDKEPAFIDD